MDGNVKAIELQGIVRNRTKIGVEDGKAEDLLNLRFVDGSWRTSGDGRKVYVMSDNANGYHYTQLYIHTNVYRHLLGVRDGKLWWFADIESDGVTFAPKSTPEELTAVTGDMWITQTGHLLTVIDEADNFEYFVFKIGDEKYEQIVIDENGKQTDRELYPFGQVHFNIYNTIDDDHIFMYDGLREQIKFGTISFSGASSTIIPDSLKIMIDNIEKKNKLYGIYLVVAACKLYDGTYAFCSQPALIAPRDLLNCENTYVNDEGIQHSKNEIYHAIDKDLAIIKNGNFYGATHAVIINNNAEFITEIGDYNGHPISVASNSRIPSVVLGGVNSYHPFILGSDLVCSITNTDFLNNTITSFCIFITKAVSLYDENEDEYKKYEHMSDYPHIGIHSERPANDTYFVGINPIRRDKTSIIYDLTHSPLYLLREYDKNNINELLSNPIVDLSSEEYNGLLSNLVQQPTLDYEYYSRKTYLPKYTYQYNGRLHFANYKTTQFHGYPIDMFHLHNHSVKMETGNYFKGVLVNLTDNNDTSLQYEKKDYAFPILSQSDINMYKELNRVFAFVEVDINAFNGVQKVVRYIEPYITIPAQQGRADFIESLNSILTFPDYRATSMRICILAVNSSNVPVFYEKTFALQPHPLYNMAYYIDPDLRPISIETLNRIVELPTEFNTTEFFPNGLKVSKTGNPMLFPVENTYQVGSGEILAMCSNSIAVGTGQTGAAPLYVFCSDGIYALFVDSSGEMTYTNARVIARDVLNNPRSVTPIDAGVAFTTDRGLMLIAGEQVQEIGQPAEGDVLRYTDDHSADFIKIAEGAFTKVADFPNTLCDKTDFLTYLTGAIVNYNHNERELMISNPEKDYSYILDRNGNWSRRDYSADEYIQNYPTSYRLRDGEFYKVDEEGDNDTTLEKRKEADNKFFYLSNVIKLDSIGFKQAARFALRGYFDTKREVVHEYSGMCVQNGYFDIVLDYKTKIKPRTHYRMTFENQSALIGTDLSISYGARATNGDIYVSETGEHKIPDSPDYAPIELNIYTSAFDHGKDVDALVVRLFNNGNTSSICKGKITFQEMNDDFSTEQNDYIGCYIFGSYDGRKWAMLGGNEKQGKFTDIGCKIERTDVKFFRICLSGKLRGESRIDYMEISSEPSILNGKIR